MLRCQAILCLEQNLDHLSVRCGIFHCDADGMSPNVSPHRTDVAQKQTVCATAFHKHRGIQRSFREMAKQEIRDPRNDLPVFKGGELFGQLFTESMGLNISGSVVFWVL